MFKVGDKVEVVCHSPNEKGWCFQKDSRIISEVSYVDNDYGLFLVAVSDDYDAWFKDYEISHSDLNVTVDVNGRKFKSGSLVRFHEDSRDLITVGVLYNNYPVVVAKDTKECKLYEIGINYCSHI